MGTRYYINKRINKNNLSYAKKPTQKVVFMQDLKGEKMSWEGTSIKYARKERGLTQQQLSDLLDIPKRTIEEWERGTRTPPNYVAKLIVFRLRHLNY